MWRRRRGDQYDDKNTHPSIITAVISNTIDFEAQLEEINSY